MSDFQLNSVSTPAPISQIRPIETPRPPKSQSDHKPLNPPTAAHGPAVVLSGALARPPERHGQAAPQVQAKVEPKATGQHVNHVI